MHRGWVEVRRGVKENFWLGDAHEHPSCPHHRMLLICPFSKRRFQVHFSFRQEIDELIEDIRYISSREIFHKGGHFE
jgi:hypothetical protein